MTATCSHQSNQYSQALECTFAWLFHLPRLLLKDFYPMGEHMIEEQNRILVSRTLSEIQMHRYRKSGIFGGSANFPANQSILKLFI